MNELVHAVFGTAARPFPTQAALDRSVPLFAGLAYPARRLAIILGGAFTAAAWAWLPACTKFGMLVGAPVTNAAMIDMSGVDVRRLALATFGPGAALAGFLRAMPGPIVAIRPGMRDHGPILAFVRDLDRGAGSSQSAFIGSLLVDLADTLGRSSLTDLAHLVPPSDAAAEFGPAVASMLGCAMAAIVVFVKPRGLFPFGSSSSRWKDIDSSDTDRAEHLSCSQLCRYF